MKADSPSGSGARLPIARTSLPKNPKVLDREPNDPSNLDREVVHEPGKSRTLHEREIRSTRYCTVAAQRPRVVLTHFVLLVLPADERKNGVDPRRPEPLTSTIARTARKFAGGLWSLQMPVSERVSMFALFP